MAQLLIHKKANLDAGWGSVEFLHPDVGVFGTLSGRQPFCPLATKASRQVAAGVVIDSLSIKGSGEHGPVLASLRALAQRMMRALLCACVSRAS